MKEHNISRRSALLILRQRVGEKDAETLLKDSEDGDRFSVVNGCRIEQRGNDFVLIGTETAITDTLRVIGEK